MQILILGMHRSGTSVTARLINLMGAYFGPEGCALPLAADNPRGHWERRDFIDINTRLLMLQDCRWYDLADWRFGAAFDVPSELRYEMRNFLYGLDAHRPWFLKDPRLCLTLPAWLPLLEAPVAVLVYRDPQEIVLSLQARSKLPPDYSLALWEYHAVGLLNATRHLPRLHVSHADMLARPAETAAALHAQLTARGVPRLTLPQAQEIEAAIDPSLYRARVESPAVALSPAQEALAQMLQGVRPQQDRLHVSRPSEAMARTAFATITEAKKALRKRKA